jgi:hypothetical protein
MLTDALEKLMNIKAMEGYPRSLRMTRPPVDVNMEKIQGQISTLTENIQELKIPRSERPQVWFTGCYMEGNMANECPQLRGMGPP